MAYLPISCPRWLAKMVACKKTSNPAFVKYKGLKARVEKTDIHYIILLEVQMQEHPLTRGAERTLSRLKNLGWAEKCGPALKSVRGVVAAAQ